MDIIFTLDTGPILLADPTECDSRKESLNFPSCSESVFLAVPTYGGSRKGSLNFPSCSESVFLAVSI